jgi:transposase
MARSAGHPSADAVSIKVAADMLGVSKGRVCSSCGFTCNADVNAAVNVAAGPRRWDDAQAAERP